MREARHLGTRATRDGRPEVLEGISPFVQRSDQMGGAVAKRPLTERTGEEAASANAQRTASRTLRVLLVEDRSDDEELVLLELRRGGYKVLHERVETAAAMSAALARDGWDVILSDFAMPRFSGPAALAVVRASGFDIPFIIVSGTVGDEAAVAAMRSGANDYVLKGNLSRLCPAIDRELREAASRAEQRKMQEQLLISDRMASVGTLAAGVAHEINNPLSAVVANLELVMKDLARVSEELQIDDRFVDIFDQLRDARDGADRLRHIVRDLKIFSRSSDVERRGPVDVRRVLESSLRMAWNEIRHRARLIKEYGAVPPVEANEARLGQLFLNLIVNAAQAIREGNADQNVIRVSTELEAASGWIVVEVRDSGAGIPPEHLPRIFDAFFTTKPVGIGTGLGLSICHRIVTGFGGEISVQSQVGKGTVFRILLPPAADSDVELTPPALVVATPARRGKILVIDDEQMLAKALGRALTPEHDVTIVFNAGDGQRRIAAGERYDVIICDLMMPQMSGMDLHAELSRTFPEQASRMVFVTGGAFTQGARTFLDDVPNQRIEKPFDTQHIRSIINDRIK
jgi:signal transduction histidine kinase